MTSEESNWLRIGRIRLHYHLPRRHPAPEQLRADLDALVARRLAGECDRLCSSVWPDHDDSLWFIRRLSVNLTLSTGRDLEAQVRKLAAEIARALARALHGGQGEEVVCFKQHKEFVAQFLIDLVQQRAWSKWYYREFEGLRSLPEPAAILEALLRQPDKAASVLLCLHGAGQLEPVFQQLNDGQLEKLLAACQPAASADKSEQLDYLRAVVEAWPLIQPCVSRNGLLSARQALRLWVSVRRRRPELASDAALRAAIQVVFELLESLPGLTEPGGFEYYVSRGDIASASLLLPESVRSRLLAFESDPGLLHRLFESTQQSQAPGASVDSQELAFVTPFGAAFLLLRVWGALELEDLVQADGCTVPEGWDRAATFRFITILKCMGRARLEEAMADRGLRLAAGFEKACTMADLRWWLGVAGDHSGLLCQYIFKLHEFGHIKGSFMRVEAVERRDHSVFVVQDLETGFWVYAGIVRRDDLSPARPVAQALAQIEQATGERVLCLVVGEASDAAFLRELDRAANTTVLWERPSAPGECHEIRWRGRDGECVFWSRELVELPAGFTSVRAWPARRARLLADLDYYDLGDKTAMLSHPSNLAWSLIASGVMKSFARRLMGFDDSSAEYLYANFFAGTSAVTMQPEKLEVRLPRVPLDVVLRLSGLDGQSFPQPGHPERMIELQLH
jgi:hypothetical protein